MLSKIKPYSIYVVILAVLANSCGAVVRMKGNQYLTEEHGAIPIDFRGDNTTIIFITHHRSYNKYLKRNVKKHYHGSYEFITAGEFEENDKYLDTNIYRYVFDYKYISPGGVVFKNQTVTSGNFSTTMSTARAPLYNVKKFSIWDRQNDLIYSSKITSSFWSKLQKVYLKKLEKKRITSM
ncbi:hypothetical protein [Snuella sedimenti]|uniref:Uncharacterized protein n=1 Tax=Snuella sedimenti TaxID=2798802 RepID=A0A8J7IXA1_9FLAO|nr:hypothetical protein [Snuella sedimenti]MBJ6368905.1 hypothetical protein [Snuella sedimenti]